MANLTKEIESIIRKEAKEQAYKNYQADKNAMITNLVQSANIDWLCRQSESFRAFYNHILRFIDGADSVAGNAHP